MTIEVTLTQHLKSLELNEAKKRPGDRKSVPSLSDIAIAAAMTRQNCSVQVTKMEQDPDHPINRKIMNAALYVLNHAGFSTGLDNLIKG